MQLTDYHVFRAYVMSATESDEAIATFGSDLFFLRISTPFSPKLVTLLHPIRIWVRRCCYWPPFGYCHRRRLSFDARPLDYLVLAAK